MKLAQYFVDRPIFASVLSVVIVMLGVVAMMRLPISEYPNVVPPGIAITAAYPGASPETIADTVAGPLEQQMVGVEGLLYLHSQGNADGTMAVNLTFAIGTDIDKALSDVENRLQRALPRLPEEVRLSLRRGEILGLAGLVGAGRTELLRAVFGLDPIRAGRVRVSDGWDTGASPAHRLAQGVGLLSEDRAAEGLALDLSVVDNLTLSRPVVRLGFVSRTAQAAAMPSQASSSD